MMIIINVFTNCYVVKTVVLCQTMLACNNDDNFADAKTFRPSRWIDTAHLDTSLVVPFGIGRRTCPGRRFVDMELTLLLAKVNFFKYCNVINCVFNPFPSPWYRWFVASKFPIVESYRLSSSICWCPKRPSASVSGTGHQLRVLDRNIRANTQI